MNSPRRRHVMFTLTLATLLGVTLIGACGEESKTTENASPVVVEPAPDPVTITANVAGFVFRYIDPTTGKVSSAATVDEIPQEARAQVVVYQDSAPPPAGWDHVADLRKLPATTSPQQGFRLRPPRAKPLPAADTAKEVVMFVRDGCGFCTKADAWMTRKSVRFEKLNLDHSPKASRRLAELAKRAGIPASSLRGVPIIFVGTQAIVGFDRPRLAKLLGV